MPLAFGALAAAWAGGPRPARGAEHPGRSARLQWQREPGAETCITSEELAAGLQRRLRRGTVGGPEAELTLEGVILPAEGRPGWRAWIVVRDRAGRATGSREFSSDEASCRALDEALLLVLSVIVEPSLALEPAAGAPRPPPPPASGPGAGRREEAVWGYAAAGGGAAVGLVPGLGGGLAGGAGLRLWGGPVFELEAAHWFATRAAREVTSAAGLSEIGRANVSATYGGLDVCALPVDRRPWHVLGCLGAQAGVVRAVGVEFRGENLTQTRPLVNAAARVEGRFDLGGPLFVRALAGVAVPLVRDKFNFDGRTIGEATLYRFAPVSGTFGAQVGVTFR